MRHKRDKYSGGCDDHSNDEVEKLFIFAAKENKQHAEGPQIGEALSGGLENVDFMASPNL